MNADEMLGGLPGEDLIREGLVDASQGRGTIPSLLVAIALPRLRRAGIAGEVSSHLQVDSELQLYRLLRSSPGDAYSQYNGLLRRLAAFEQALDHRIQRRNLASLIKQPVPRSTPAPAPSAQ
jgi:hypothetical protein